MLKSKDTIKLEEIIKQAKEITNTSNSKMIDVYSFVKEIAKLTK